MFTNHKNNWISSGTSEHHTTDAKITSHLDFGLPACERGSHTLVIPTYNRVDYLHQLVNYLEQIKLQSKILVFDSSAKANLDLNSIHIKSKALDIEHHIFPQEIDPYEKMHIGLQKVQTEYTSACADDDLIILPGLRASITELMKNDKLAGCHGVYVNFQYKDECVNLSHIEQIDSDVYGETQIARLDNFMRSYHVLFYTVQRTSVAKVCFKNNATFSTTLLKELHSSVTQVINGQISRLNIPYMARNTAPSLSYSGWHPHQIIANKPDRLFTDYLLFRDTILKQMKKGLKANEFKSEMIDIIFLSYLGAFLTQPVMHFILDERLVKQRSGEETTRNLWNVFVANYRERHRRVPLFDKETKIFNPGARRIHSTPLDYLQTTFVEAKKVNFMIFHEFLFPNQDSGLKIKKENLALVLDSLSLYFKAS